MCQNNWISLKMDLISRILSENAKGNYKERYGSLLEMKNHVKDHIGKSPRL